MTSKFVKYLLISTALSAFMTFISILDNNIKLGLFGYTLFFIFSSIIPAIGAFIGNFLREFTIPDSIFTSGGMIGILKAKLFWMFGPQCIGWCIGLFIASSMVSVPAQKEIKDKTDTHAQHSEQSFENNNSNSYNSRPEQVISTPQLAPKESISDKNEKESQQHLATSSQVTQQNTDTQQRILDLEKTIIQQKYNTQQQSQIQEQATPQPQPQPQKETQQLNKIIDNDNSVQNFSPSFDCSKASTNQELLICQDRDLSKLDSEMSICYNSLIKLSPDKENIRLQQRKWLKNRNTLSTKEQLIRHYSSRIAELRILSGE